MTVVARQAGKAFQVTRLDVRYNVLLVDTRVCAFR